MKKYIILLFITSPFFLKSQEPVKKETRKERIEKANQKTKKLQKDSEEGAIIFNKQSSFNITLRNDGYAFGYERGKFKKINKTNLWWVHLGERKHLKEEKLSQEFAGFQVGNPFIYGKENNFYFLNIGLGQQKLLGGKSTKNGVAVSAIYGGGLTLGLLKPYYLEVIGRKPGTIDEIKWNDDNPDLRFLNSDSILGAASLGKGFNEIKISPGAFAKAAIRFDYGKFNDVVSAIEIGISGEYYFQKVPQMVLLKEKNFFLNGYITLIFGSRK